MSGWPETWRICAMMLRRLILSPASSISGTSEEVVFGTCGVGRRLNFMRMGTETASPKAIASPLPSEEMKLVAESELSGIAERMMS